MPGTNHRTTWILILTSVIVFVLLLGYARVHIVRSHDLSFQEVSTEERQEILKTVRRIETLLLAAEEEESE